MCKKSTATKQKSGAELGKIFSDVFAGTPFGKQSPAPEKECNCYTCNGQDCDHCPEPQKGSDYLGEMIEHKAIFHRLDVLLTLVSDLSIRIRPDLPRVLSLMEECKNLVNDGNASIERSGLTL